MSPVDLITFVSSMDDQSLEELKKFRRDLGEKQREALQKIRAKVADFQAEAFLGYLEFFVQDGIAKRLDLEKGQPGEYEEPGWRQHYLGVFFGWIPVYEVEAKFIRRSNENDIQTPDWVVKVIEKMKAQGIEMTVKKKIFAEPGIGNHATAFLCIRDPRHSQVSQPTKV